MRDIGKNIKDLRIKADMTQDELAQLLFVTRQTVSNYETGNSRPDVDMLVKIAESFRVEVDSVIYGPQIDPKQKRRRWQAVILIVVTVLLGIALAVVTNTVQDCVREFGKWTFVVLISPQIICANWLKPAWLLLVGWTFVHGLCEFCSAKTLQPPASHYIKWGIIAFIAGYIILILPHSVWFLLEDIKSWQRHNNHFVGEYTSYFSLSRTWDWLALRVLSLVKKFGGWQQVVFEVLDYLPLPLGALLRLCRKPAKE